MPEVVRAPGKRGVASTGVSEPAVRSKGSLYLALHPHGTHAWGRWVGMSYDGAVITGWGASPHSRGGPQADLGPDRYERVLIMHRSRVCHFVIDVSDLDKGAAFWSAALGAVEEPLPEVSSSIYRHLRLPDLEIRILLQKTNDPKA